MYDMMFKYLYLQQEFLIKLLVKSGFLGKLLIFVELQS